MLKLKRVTLKNFLSVGNVMQTVDLQNDGLTLVLGENLDLGGGGSRNGVGKTALLNSICYGLFGLPLFNIRKDNLINNINEKNMEVSIEFEKNGHTYRIERGRKPNYIRYIVNNNLVNAPDTDESEGDSKWTQQEIERILGFSYTIFKHIIGLNTYTEPFLSLKSGEQREIIEQLLGITQLSEKAEVLKKLLKETRDFITLEDAKIQAIQESNNRIQKIIDENERRSEMWRIQHVTRLEKLESELQAFLTIDFDSELQKFAALEEWEKANAKIEAEIRSFEKDLEVASNNHARILAEIQSLKSQTEFSNKKTIQLREGSIARYQQEISRKTQALEVIAQDIQALTHSLENPLEHECSQCGQSLNGTDHLEQVLKNIQSLLEAKALEYQETEVSIKELNDSILHTQEEIKKLQRDELEKQARNSDRIQALTADLDKSQLQVALYQQKIQTQKQQLSALPSKPQMHFKTKNQLFESKNAYEQLLKDLNTELEKTNPYAEQSQELKTSGLQPISYDNINELNKLREHQEFLLKLLTSKESFIRKKIIDQNISYLNARLNHYLDKLGLPHEVKFLNDLSVEIFYLGRELDFDNLSRGERTRLILGLSWSFRDVYESLNLPINLLFIDELLDSGLDISGLENSLELIKKMGRERGKNIFLISHKDELTSRVNNLLYVRKENGFTTFDTGEENA
jgi:DNA repair exonuclease SbcCD ATPase subunit